jgi:hypothetical protein
MLNLSFKSRRFARTAAVALASVAAVTACDQSVVAPGASQSIRYHYGDFLLPIAAIHMPDTVTDTLRMTFDVEPGENPCAFSNFVTTISYDAAYFAPYGVKHPGASCKQAEMTIDWHTFRPMRSTFGDDTLETAPLRMVVCQQHRPPIVKALRYDMKRYARVVLPMRPRNEDSISTFDATFCRRVADAI